MTKADWLRSEIEKLEGMLRPNAKLGGRSQVDERDNYFFNLSITSIITRYKEELLELEKGV